MVDAVILPDGGYWSVEGGSRVGFDLALSKIASCATCATMLALLPTIVPLDDGTHLITIKPIGFYSRVHT